MYYNTICQNETIKEFLYYTVTFVKHYAIKIVSSEARQKEFSCYLEKAKLKNRKFKMNDNMRQR